MPGLTILLVAIGRGMAERTTATMKVSSRSKRPDTLSAQEDVAVRVPSLTIPRDANRHGPGYGKRPRSFRFDDALAVLPVP
jgi:hypothetical protein